MMFTRATRAATLRTPLLFRRAGFRILVDGHERSVPPLWLRLNEPSRFTPNGQRTFEIADVVAAGCADIAHHACDEDSLRIEWADGVRSVFPNDWLREQLAMARSAPSGQGPHLWNSKLSSFLPEVQFEELSSEDLGGGPASGVADGLLRIATYLDRYGLAILRNVPSKRGMVEAVGNQIGFVRETNYGSVFDVIDLGSSGNNLAQTNCRIRAHTDNPYRDPFPGVQLLHCLANATAGGSTTFTDGFAAAERLRAQNPEAFHLLSTVSHPFEYRDPTRGVLLRAVAPVLTTDAHGAVQRVTFNNRSAGCIPPHALPPGQLERYYAGWAEFDALCNSDELVLRLRLAPGDLAVFSNSRIMHGREEYTAGEGRHIQGCYVDHDALRSRVDWAAVAGGEGCQSPRFDTHLEAVTRAMDALATQASFSYGEGVDMLTHALQAANCARLEGEPAAAVLAALMHDVGNSPQARAHWKRTRQEEPPLLTSPSDGSIGYARHAEMGGAYVGEALGFSAEVANAVALHVSAKRALVAMDPAYLRVLSQASIDTLAHQGGAMTAEELDAFHATAGSEIALRLRRHLLPTPHTTNTAPHHTPLTPHHTTHH